ncbi:hypothetical protein MASR1M74_17050 [Lentimicrobium sp.]
MFPIPIAAPIAASGSDAAPSYAKESQISYGYVKRIVKSVIKKDLSGYSII